MLAYIFRRLLFMVPTILGIMVINFALVQFLPGGPIEQILSQLDDESSATDRISGGGGDGVGSGGQQNESSYQGARGLPDGFIEDLEKQFGFDKPPAQRFALMMGNYLRFDFGESYFRSISVIDLVLEKMPVSITLGLWSTLLAYLISIPLGIRKAVHDGGRFDVWSSSIIIFAYAIPGFLFAIILVVMFAGGSYFQWFPLRGLTSDNFDTFQHRRANSGLFMAYCSARHRIYHRRLCHIDAFNKERVFGRAGEIIRDDRPRQRFE